MKKIPFGVWLTVALVGLLGLSVWVGNTTQKKTIARHEVIPTRELAFECVTHTGIGYHVHPTLSIVIDGEPYTVPADIGITPSCMNSLHTHDATGVIHIESTIARDFVLGDFFAVWGQPFSKDTLLDKVADQSYEIVITVNGERVDTYEQTVMRDLDEIVISYQKKQ